MTDDHDMRIECAERLTKLEEGRQMNSDAIDKQTGAIKTLTGEVRSGMKDLGSIVRASQAEMMKAFGDLKADTVRNEASTRSAHHRLDTHQKMIWGIVVAILALGLTAYKFGVFGG